MYALAARSLVFFFLSLFAHVSGIGATALAQQPQRFAFVVTVQKYTNSVVPLQYSDSDGEIVSGALKKVGFRVRWLRDASKSDFFSEFDGFIDEVKRAGPNAVVLFYFSGHSVADVSNGTNHLILNGQILSPPEGGIDARNFASYLPEIGIPLKTITTAIGKLNAQASFVVIDSHLDVTEPALLNEALRSRPAGGPHNGMMLVAQGRPGMQAADTNDFSRALAGALQTPGLDAVAVFKQVQVKVAEVTNDFHGIPAHFEIKVRRQGAVIPAPKSTVTNISISNSHGFQIGDHNIQSIVNSLKYVLKAIDESSAAPEAKAEAKSRLKAFLEHPLTSALLGGAVGSLF